MKMPSLTISRKQTNPPKKKPTHKKARNSLQNWEIPISAGCFHIYFILPFERSDAA